MDYEPDRDVIKMGGVSDVYFDDTVRRRFKGHKIHKYSSHASYRGGWSTSVFFSIEAEPGTPDKFIDSNIKTGEYRSVIRDLDTGKVIRTGEIHNTFEKARNDGYKLRFDENKNYHMVEPVEVKVVRVARFTTRYKEYGVDRRDNRVSTETEGYVFPTQEKHIKKLTSSKRKKPISFKRSSTPKAPRGSASTSIGRGWHKESHRHTVASIKGWRNRK